MFAYSLINMRMYQNSIVKYIILALKREKEEDCRA